MEDKQGIRQATWERLRRGKAARFPFPIEGRIPNFKGAEAAAARLFASEAWRRARTLKANPDSPQRPVRQRALEEGKLVFMAVPRLRAERCFVRLDPRRIAPEHYAKAAMISGMETYGEAVYPDDLPHIDLVVAGSVAVRSDGARIGKGGGYSDLEFGIATRLGKVDPETAIVTTVHDVQVVEARWAVRRHDIPLDWIFTPTRGIRCGGGFPRPPGILWEELDPAMGRDVPVLAGLRE